MTGRLQKYIAAGFVMVTLCLAGWAQAEGTADPALMSAGIAAIRRGDLAAAEKSFLETNPEYRLRWWP